MQDFQQTLYRSVSASIVDVTAVISPFGSAQVPLDRTSVAFVRSGLFVKRQNAGAFIVDPNYVVFGDDGDTLVPVACGMDACSCTIIRYTFDSPAGTRRGCVLSTARAFLVHARLLYQARAGHRDLEAAALGLLRMPLDEEKPKACAHSVLVSEVRRLVNESLPGRLKLAQLAHHLYMSPFALSRLFHRETGVPLRTYALRLRLRRALDAVLSSGKSLTEIARECGFYDEPHFSNAFHSEFGTSPYSVRKYSRNPIFDYL